MPQRPWGKHVRVCLVLGLGQTAARTQDAAVKEALVQERGLGLGLATRQLPAMPGLLPHATAGPLPWRRDSGSWGRASDVTLSEPCSLQSGLHGNLLSTVSLFPPPLTCVHEAAAMHASHASREACIAAAPFGSVNRPPSMETRTIPCSRDPFLHNDGPPGPWGSYHAAFLQGAHGSWGRSPCSASLSLPNFSGKSSSSVESFADGCVPFFSDPGPATRRVCFRDMSSETSSQLWPLGSQQEASAVPVGPISRQQGFACLQPSLEVAVPQRGLSAGPSRIASLFNSPLEHVPATSLSPGNWSKPSDPARPADADG